MGLIAIYTPFFLLNAPLFNFFGNSFSVTLRNFTNFVTILIFLPQGYESLRIMYLLLFYLSKKSRKLTDCAKTPLFDFRHITDFHGSRKPASFRFLGRLGTSFIVQQGTPSISKRLTKDCMSSSNNPRTKLGYDSCPSLLTSHRR